MCLEVLARKLLRPMGTGFKIMALLKEFKPNGTMCSEGMPGLGPNGLGQNGVVCSGQVMRS